MGATIRMMTDDDAFLLEDFLYHAIFVPPGTEPPLRTVIFEPEIYLYAKDFGEPDDCGFVAEQDGKAVGAAWTRIIPAYGHIDDNTPELAISVLPGYRGQGIGTALLTRLFEVLRERGYQRTSLSVQKGNPALRLYKRMGYAIIGEKRDHANHEDYIMVKELNKIERSVFIRPLSEISVVPAMGLVWRIFSAFTAPEYSKEGIDQFKAFIDPSKIATKMRHGESWMWGAFDHERIIGVILVKPPLHISLLFVDEAYHRRGIARTLFETAIEDEAVTRGHTCMTVHSSPFAVEIYHRLGFKQTGAERTENGIRFTPMEFKL